jgi:hypothetical protein
LTSFDFASFTSEAPGFAFVMKTYKFIIALMGVKILLCQSRNFVMAKEIGVYSGTI